MVGLPVDFSAISGAINGADLASNFDALNAKFGNITSADIAASAGILSTQLSERYHYPEVVFSLATHGPTSATYISAPGTFTIDGSTTRIYRRRVKARSGQLVWLCEIEIYADNITNPGGAVPRVEVYKNGVLIPGATFDLDTDDDFYYLRRSDPLANPLLAFVNDDVIEYRLGRSAAVAGVGLAGCQVHEIWKRPLGV